jgi:hypothetical protein
MKLMGGEAPNVAVAQTGRQIVTEAGGNAALTYVCFHWTWSLNLERGRTRRDILADIGK